MLGIRDYGMTLFDVRIMSCWGVEDRPVTAVVFKRVGAIA